MSNTERPCIDRKPHDMRPGAYLAQTWRNGGRGSVSWWAGGPGKLAHCLKCRRCGHSVTA